MVAISKRKYKFLLLFFFQCCSFVSVAQKLDITAYYAQKIEENDFSLQEKEQLIDSLQYLKNIEVDTLQLVKIYRSIIYENNFSDLKKMIFYTEKIESIAVALNNFDIDDFKKNHRNNISFLCKDKKYYRALLSAKKYLRRYKKVDKYLGKVYRSIADIYGESGDIELAIVNYDQSIYLLKNIKIKKN